MSTSENRQSFKLAKVSRYTVLVIYDLKGGGAKSTIQYYNYDYPEDKTSFSSPMGGLNYEV